MDRRTVLASLAALPALSARAGAHSYSQGKIAIGHAWALPAQQTDDGQLFFPMVNNGTEQDELVAARSSICALIELRGNNRYDDPPLKSFVLEPGKPIPMRPTARHLRLVGLREPLTAGQTFKVVLDFLNAGEAGIEVLVENGPGH